ncbi:MAG: hypothetical protein LAQ69_06665 [Acidobacteriia bacterium]|nr:hypothetical protein [Terriglobia bacterium]
MFDRVGRRSLILMLPLVFGSAGRGQSLQLAAGATLPGGSAVLNLSFTASPFNQLAALQWTLTYAPAEILSLTAVAGPSAASADKLLTCSARAGSLTCILAGMNSNTIPNGIVAFVNVTLAPTLTTSTTVGVANTLGASSAGDAVLVNAAAPAQMAVYRSGVWVFDTNGNGSFDLTDRFSSFGLSGDQPVAGDWDGTGAVRIGVFRGGLWYLDLNDNGQWDGVAGGDGIFAFGMPGDVAVTGDWNGDGRSKLGIFRCPQTGVCTWVLDYAGKFGYDAATAKSFSYGSPGDIPVVNNWNATSNIDQIGVYRPMPNGQGLWIVDSNGSGAWEPSDAMYWFGLASDLPVVGNWDNGTRKRIGVFRGGVWILDTNGNNAYDATDAVRFFGLPGDHPVVGKW